MIETCKCCGAVIPEPAQNLSPTQRKLYAFVAKHPGVTLDQIFNHLYADRADGGPLYTNIVSVFISTMNKILVGQRIRADKPGPGATYRLIKDPA